jgi:tetratricopeptide (TPR) repeat protein
VRPPVQPADRGPASPLALLADEFANGDRLARWASGFLRRADQEERAGDCQAAITTLQTAMACCSDLRLRAQRDRLRAPLARALAEEQRARAVEAEQANRHRDAAEHWRKVLEADGSDKQAALHAASCFMQAGDTRQAGQYAKRATELEPNDPQARRLLLRCYEAMGMTQSAAREREALEELQRRR